MTKNRYFDMVNGEKLLRKMLNYIFTDYKGMIGIDGPKSSGKSSIVEELSLRLSEEGFVLINFNLEHFVQSENMLLDFIGILTKEISNVVGKKYINRFLKERKIKKIIKKNLENQRRAAKFKKQKKLKEELLDKNLMIISGILKDLNAIIVEFGIRMLLTFDNLTNLELHSIFKAQSLFEIIAVELRNVVVVTTIDSQYLTANDIKDIEIRKVFGVLYDIRKEFDSYNHHVPQVKEWIKQNKIYDISLIRSIDFELDLIEKLLRRSYDFHLNENDKERYFDELCFMFWILKYMKMHDNESFVRTVSYMEQYADIKRGKRIYDINDFPNLSLIANALKREGYTFGTKNMVYEILKLLEVPLKNEIPVFIVFANKKYFNIVNELLMFYIFSSGLIGIDSIYDERKSLTFMLDQNNINPYINKGFALLKPRTLEELQNSRNKSIFDNELFSIIQTFFDLL
ncbi:hypothetical protein SCHIN_v1c06100 [Spiroplasma chinense]|uniref:KAP NTPase domain-containing protein n=1 Tax=Spiroplasma chinense TaxID=216932 RepID=A0A5B9Y6B9_9MOLU|nr:hypothetical protein [Spiroplasma chinense]QEH61807.1 hypothetical protein SCHIN_v1c06100 [Spiroplasma chinense]